MIFNSSIRSPFYLQLSMCLFTFCYPPWYTVLILTKGGITK
nr:MAG TPA: hypothetical protein [Caudoviricetes sp.]